MLSKHPPWKTVSFCFLRHKPWCFMLLSWGDRVDLIHFNVSWLLLATFSQDPKDRGEFRLCGWAQACTRHAGKEPWLREPKQFITHSEHVCPLFWRETLSVFQGCLLHKHPWKDSLKQAATSASACKVGRDTRNPRKTVSRQYTVKLQTCLAIAYDCSTPKAIPGP